MNTYADAIRRQVDDAPRAALPAVAKAMWSAFAAGQITEAEAEALSVLIEARQTKHETVSHLPGEAHTGRDTPQVRQNRPRAGGGSRPRTNASLERRRRWAASGRLPPALAAKFSLAEHAVLALIATETARRGGLPLVRPTSRRPGRRGRDDGSECDPRGPQARPAHGRGTQGDGLPQPAEHRAHRLAGMDGLVTPGAEGGAVTASPCPRGRVQILEPHAYSGSSTGENEDAAGPEKRGRNPDFAFTGHVAKCRRMRPTLCCGRRRDGLTLMGMGCCRGAVCRATVALLLMRREKSDTHPIAAFSAMYI